ncbi:MAG TPA: zinc-binding dehydrogenase [Atopobiaceae bacterium]|nr:zinc-binding dehydrogenase [Atopobiaceae bacterium]
MKTTMASLYGKMDIRIRETELPEIADDEILMRVETNGICLSTHKAAKLGTEHMRVPDNIAEVPIVTGHEFAGTIEKVGKKWQGKYRVGQRGTIQAAYRYQGKEWAPGYSFEFFGGNTLYSILPDGLMEMDYLITYDDDYFAFASLSEPTSCIIGAFNTLYHEKLQCYDLFPGNLEGGNMALMASCGPMGIGAIDYAVNGPRKPHLLVVTDVDKARLARAEELITVEDAAANGVELHYLDMNEYDDGYGVLMDLTVGKGFDDTIVFAAVPSVLELANRTLGYNGCLNLFAGPIDKSFSAHVNYYDIHYRKTHLVGNSGGNLDDIREAVRGAQEGWLHPEYMITHVLGLKDVPDTILTLPQIPGGKKMVYTHCDIPFMALEDFDARRDEDPVFAEIADILAANKGVWCKEAEKVLLEKKSRF